MASLPVHQTAVLVAGAGKLALTRSHPTPSPLPDELQIRVHAAALNPSDWMARDWTPVPGSVLGFDYAGTIVAVGSSVDAKWKPGDKVAGFVQGGNPADLRAGAYAEYIIAPEHTALHIPAEMGFDEAATYGMGVMTAAQALFQTLQLPLPLHGVSEDRTVFIYGASTATGQFAVQLAKLSGAHVVATSGKANIQRIKELGADVVIDYATPDALEQVRAATDGGVGLVMDCISTTTTVEFCMQCFSSKGGRYAALLPGISDVQKRGVSGPTFKVCYTAFGKDTIGYKAGVDDKDVAQRVFEVAEKLVGDGKLRPLKIRVLEGGLAAVEEAVTKVKEGKVRGEKWVVRIAETPDLTDD